jgi:hypothetical protein
VRLAAATAGLAAAAAACATAAAPGQACRAAFLDRVDAGEVRSVNGLAVAPDFAAYIVTDWVPGEEGSRARLMARACRDGVWSEPEPVFPGAAHSDYQPTLSADGARLYFTSTRPLEPGGEPARQNVWTATRSAAGGWAPAPVRHLASEAWDGHAVELAPGALVFASDRPGGAGLVDLYAASPTDAAAGVTPLAALNTRASDNDMAFDRASGVLVFARYDADSGDIDLYGAARAPGGWSEAVALDALNSGEWDFSPAFTPDGETFLFKRGEGPFRRIDAGAVIDAVRARVLVRAGSTDIEMDQGTTT